MTIRSANTTGPAPPFSNAVLAQEGVCYPPGLFVGAPKAGMDYTWLGGRQHDDVNFDHKEDMFARTAINTVEWTVTKITGTVWRVELTAPKTARRMLAVGDVIEPGELEICSNKMDAREFCLRVGERLDYIKLTPGLRHQLTKPATLVWVGLCHNIDWRLRWRDQSAV